MQQTCCAQFLTPFPCLFAAANPSRQIALLLMQPNHFMQVLRLEAEQLPALGDHDVLINVLAVGRGTQHVACLHCNKATLVGLGRTRTCP